MSNFTLILPLHEVRIKPLNENFKRTGDFLFATVNLGIECKAFFCFDIEIVFFQCLFFERYGDC